MNKERILKLAEIIRTQPHTSLDSANGFQMRNYYHDCGTPACIAGWAVFTYDKRKYYLDLSIGEIFVSAKENLDISIDDAYDLFIPTHKILDDITPEEAADTLKYLAETGKVEWLPEKRACIKPQM